MHRSLLAVVAATAVLAGCSDPAAPAEGAGEDLAPSTMSILGVVQDEQLTPVAGAAVQVRMLNISTTTDAAGSFRFEGLMLSAYLVDVAADGFDNATLTAEPTATYTSSLVFVLVKPASLRPATEVMRFEGLYQCGFEALILPGSCDVLVEESGVGPFEDTSTFQLGLRPNWQAVAIDVDFDLSANPGLEGLRLVVRGIDDADSTGTYQQYGRFQDGGPFTAVVEVGQTYPDGMGPVPANLTALDLVVYPQGHGWHATCAAGEGACTLGVGAGIDVAFDLYVTVFYNQPAPDGYTLLA